MKNFLIKSVVFTTIFISGLSIFQLITKGWSTSRGGTPQSDIYSSSGDILTSDKLNSIVSKILTSNAGTWTTNTGGNLESGVGVKIGNTSVTCDTENKGTLRVENDELEYCNGAERKAITTKYRGTIDNPGLSCLDIKENDGDFGNRTYYINIGGSIKEVYCDMESDGGGWTLVAVNSSADGTTATTGTYGTPVPAIDHEGDWKYSDTDINTIKGGTDSSENGYRITYLKKGTGSHLGKHYFWARSCNLNTSQLAATNGTACVNWSVHVNDIGTYTGDGDTGWYGLARRKGGWGNNGWYYNGRTNIRCYEDGSYDGANQTGTCDGSNGLVSNLSTYLWVR